MQKAVLLLCLAFAGSALAMPFEEYVKTFNKEYLSHAEYEAHFQIFTKNVADIESHNKMFDLGRVTYKKGINMFTDMTTQEQKAYRGLRVTSPKITDVCDASNLKYPVLPAAVDYRLAKPAVLSAVKDQGSCGSCWAFTTTEMVESFAALAKNVTPPVLSPQEVVSCAPNPDNCGGTGGCGGSVPELGFDYIKTAGLCANTAWPYTATTGKCNVQCSPVVGLKGCVKLPENNYTSLLSALYEVGPIAVNVDASRWNSYSSGIYTGCVDEQSYDIDHVVQLVGYGSESGQNYWIVRNSWGAAWGEQGFIRIQRHDPSDPNSCKKDFVPSDGTGCDGDPAVVTVCGECGMWYDASYPTGVFWY